MSRLKLAVKVVEICRDFDNTCFSSVFSKSNPGWTFTKGPTEEKANKSTNFLYTGSVSLSFAIYHFLFLASCNHLQHWLSGVPHETQEENLKWINKGSLGAIP